MSYKRNNKRSNYNRNQRGSNRNNKRQHHHDNHNGSTFIIKNWKDKDKFIKDGIFAFSGGQKELLIKGEGNEISTAVEVAETIKKRMYPGLEIAKVSLGSRPFYNKHSKSKGRHNNNRSKKFEKDFVSRIEILIKTKI